MDCDYKNILDCAYNRKPQRVPLYDHYVSDRIMERLTGKKFADAIQSKETYDLYFENYCAFFRDFGYDAVAFEACIGSILPGGGALGGHVDPVIKTREDFEKYPFVKLVDFYREKFDDMFQALRRHMPENMKAIGGAGNGVFEIVQDLVGYQNLCLLSYDDHELYADLFVTVGNVMISIWKYLLDNYADIYCVCRFGDDLGYRSSTLLPPDDVRKHIIRQYKRVIQVIKQYDKPFLLHSCGCIFDVMDDLIACGINAKHSNEDAIAPFSRWVEEYGDRIGNFGGIDTDMLVRASDEEIEQRVKEVYDLALAKNGGLAIGSGNSIPDYVDPHKYLVMLNTVRRLRGDKM